MLANTGAPSSVEILRFVYDQDAATTYLDELILTRAETSIDLTTASSSSLSAVPRPSSLRLHGTAGFVIRRRRKSA